MSPSPITSAALRWSTSYKPARTPTLYWIPLCIIMTITYRSGTFSQSLNWVDISGSNGFQSMHQLDDGTLFARYWQIMYRSTDDGQTWVNFPRPGGDILTYVTRNNYSIVGIFNPFVILTSQYFKSTDGGHTWQNIFYLTAPARNLMLSPSQSMYKLEIEGGRVVVENYFNGRWERVGNPSTVIHAANNLTYSVSAIDEDNNFYIGTHYDGIHSSRDGCQTWTEALPYRHINNIHTLEDGRVVISAIPDRKTNGGVFLSTDFGLSWEQIGLTNVFVNDLEENQQGQIFALTRSGVFRYVEDRSWDSLGPFYFNYNEMHITSSNKYILTSEGLGMLTSVDSGRTWHPDNLRKQDNYSICTLIDGSIIVGTLGRGIFKTTDSGIHWIQHHSSDIPDYYFCFRSCGRSVFAGTESGLHRSDDFGLTWSWLTGDLNPLEVHTPVYAIQFTPEGEIIIGTSTGVYHSTDEGLSWTARGIQTSRVLSLRIGSSGTWLAATASNGVFASTDKGHSWQNRGLVRPDIQTMAVNGAGHIVVATYAGVHRSTDNGVTWAEALFAPGNHVYSLLYNGNHQVYAGTSEGVFSSDDGGVSWESAGLGIDPMVENDGEFVIALEYDADHFLLAATYKGGVFRSFAPITPVTEISHIPQSFILFQNYPNPFNSSTKIEFELPKKSPVLITVYDVGGKQIVVLLNEERREGKHEIYFNGAGYPSGVYFCRLSSGNQQYTRKMLLLR